MSHNHLTISCLLQEWQENIIEMVITNLSKGVLSKICIIGHIFVHKMQYNENMHGN